MIGGFDQLAKQLEEISTALEDLGEHVTEVSFDPSDPGSIESAIRQVNDAIDAKVGSYSSNPMLSGIIEEMKEKYRAGILERAAQARLQGGQ